jgi:hypothetical protein
MDINHKTIDNKTRGEVGALFQGYVVQPLTEELQTKLEKAASDENDQLAAVKEELGTVKRAVIRTDSSVGKTAKEDTLKASKEEIMDELETLQNGVTAARNTITKQMQTDNEAAAQANQTLLQEMEKTQQEIETAKKIIQGELRRQGENSYETIEEGFAGTEKKMDDNFRQFGEKLEKQDEKSRDVIEKGFAGAEQKLDALSRQVDADEEKMLEQLAVIVQQLTENAASSSTQLTQYQQNLQTEMETGKSDLTETAMQKYKVLLGVSLSFGIVNFLGVVALLIINLMP